VVGLLLFLVDFKFVTTSQRNREYFNRLRFFRLLATYLQSIIIEMSIVGIFTLDICQKHFDRTLDSIQKNH
jgi:hypothetical protein